MPSGGAEAIRKDLDMSKEVFSLVTTTCELARSYLGNHKECC